MVEFSEIGTDESDPVFNLGLSHLMYIFVHIHGVL